ncbi:MAG: transposase [Coriobacteriia bacterium]|nr:transposase [Coriobacteriia bacterium]
MGRRELPEVEMPKKGIVRRRGAGGTIYIYRTIRAYRNDKGKPTSDTALIGKLAEDGVSLIPNTRYFELFPEAARPERAVMIDEIRSGGLTGAFEFLAKMIGLTSSLEQAFPDKHKAILTAAMYIAECGNVMAYIDDWLDVTDAPDQLLTSQSTSRLFASISYAERMAFFRQWVKEHADNSHIAYDVTSISTHSSSLQKAEWGHNRDGESLLQLNIGMFYGMASGLPLYYTLYNGSIVDKSHLSHMMGDADELGIDDVGFVFDKEFVTESNLAYMQEASLRFLAPCPPSRKDARSLIMRIGSGIKDPANWMADEGCYGMRTEFDLLGRKLSAHVFYDSSRFAEQERALYAYIDRLEGELAKASGRRIAKKYRDFFTFSDTHETKPLMFSRDNAAVAGALAEAGFIVFITNDETLDPQGVLKLYRRRDEVEKVFDDLKNGIDFKRFKTHTQQSTEGKAFVGFIALILRSRMLSLLQKDKATETMALKKAMLELRKLQYVVTSDGEELYLPVTKTQITIASALGLVLV